MDYPAQEPKKKDIRVNISVTIGDVTMEFFSNRETIAPNLEDIELLKNQVGSLAASALNALGQLKEYNLDKVDLPF